MSGSTRSAKARFVVVCLALLLTGLAASRSFAQTSTELSVETDDSGARTHAKFTVRVSDSINLHGGSVTLNDARGAISSAAVGPDGVATFESSSLHPGNNRISATYSAANGETSTSPAVVVSALDSGVPSFNFALSNTTLTVKAGTDANLIATITPVNGFSQLVSLSCAGNSVPLPPGVSCLFTPVNLVPAASSASVSSTLSILTTGVAGKTAAQQLPVRTSGPVLAILGPGIVVFAGLGMARKRGSRSLSLLSLTALLLVSGLGLSSCAARYHYLHNPPAANNGTPLGTYTIVITASSNSGSTVIVQPLSITLTIN